MARQYIGEERLIESGFKKQGNGRFVLTHKVRQNYGSYSAVVEEVAEVTLKDGYVVKHKGLAVDNRGHLLLYRRF